MTERELVQRVFLEGVPLDKIKDCGNGYYYELTRDCTDWGLWWYIAVRHLGTHKELECVLYAGKLDKWLETGDTCIRRDAFKITIENTFIMLTPDVRQYNDPEDWVIKIEEEPWKVK